MLKLMCRGVDVCCWQTDCASGVPAPSYRVGKVWGGVESGGLLRFCFHADALAGALLYTTAQGCFARCWLVHGISCTCLCV